MRYAAIAFLFVIIAVGCSSEPEFKIEPGSPAHAMQAFIKAVLDGDVGSYLNALDSTARAQSYGVAQKVGAGFEEMMKAKIAEYRPQYENVKIVGEKITGNIAKVTLVKEGDPDPADIDFIKEPGGWKLRLKK